MLICLPSLTLTRVPHTSSFLNSDLSCSWGSLCSCIRFCLLTGLRLWLLVVWLQTPFQLHRPVHAQWNCWLPIHVFPASSMEELFTEGPGGCDMQRLSQGDRGTGQRSSQKECAWRLIGHTGLGHTLSCWDPRVLEVWQMEVQAHFSFPDAFHTLAPMTPNLIQSSSHLQGEAVQKLQLREKR